MWPRKKKPLTRDERLIALWQAGEPKRRLQNLGLKLTLRIWLSSTRDSGAGASATTGWCPAVRKLWRRIVLVMPSVSERNALKLPVCLIRLLFRPLRRCLVNLGRSLALALLCWLLDRAQSRPSPGTRKS